MPTVGDSARLTANAKIMPPRAEAQTSLGATAAGLKPCPFNRQPDVASNLNWKLRFFVRRTVLVLAVALATFCLCSQTSLGNPQASTQSSAEPNSPSQQVIDAEA